MVALSNSNWLNPLTEKDNHLTDVEFLAKYDAQTNCSPLIRAYAERLQRYVNVGNDLPMDNRKECPVCEADLLVDIDFPNNRMDLIPEG